MRLRAPLAALLLLLAPLSAGRTTELKLATWNLNWLTLRPTGDPALPRDLISRAPEDFALLARYARRLDADILALQEVDGPEAAAKLVDPGSYAFYFADEHDVQRTGFAVRRGNGAPRVEQNADLEGLDLYPRARHSLRRGTDITVRTGATRLRLLSIHLNAGCREGPMDRTGSQCESLARQSEVLAEWIAARRREGIPFAILGDFNRRMAGTRPDEMLRTISGPEAPLLRVTEGYSDPCWSGPRGGRPFVSHILLGGGAEALWQRDSLRVLVYAERNPNAFRHRISDHCPVSILLRLP